MLHKDRFLHIYMAYLMQAVQVVNNRIYIIGANTFANPTAGEALRKVIRLGSLDDLAPLR